jgi:mannose/cellobiose epimerase-like protein (N-acyl-D-glucosamine 2-epimerase family)
MGVSARPLGAAHRPQRPDACRLVAFADRHGLDARRGVRSMPCFPTAASSRDARLWAQAERIAPVWRSGSGEEIAWRSRDCGDSSQPPHGVWFDQLTADNASFRAARATSLYTS